MDKLPTELVDWILQAYISSASKNDCLNLRLVCRAFDRTIRPLTLQTLNIDHSKLSRLSLLPRPRFDALQTIGNVCKNLYLDQRILKDEFDIEWLTDHVPILVVTDRVLANRGPSLAVTNRISAMNRRYTMNSETFTEVEYQTALQEVLFYCRDIQTLRLDLPTTVAGGHTDAATIILANTLKAFASRPEEDSVPLKTLILENVSDYAVCQLWMNPLDVKYIRKAFSGLESVYLKLKALECLESRSVFFTSCFSNILESAEHLTTLCIVGAGGHCRPVQRHKRTCSSEYPWPNWLARSLPIPTLPLPNLKRLELKCVDVQPTYFLSMLRCYGSTLEELFLNEVYLKVVRNSELNEGFDSNHILWTGCPNQPQSSETLYVAMLLRVGLPRLRICRAAFLGYDLYFRSERERGYNAMDTEPSSFDLCETINSLEQRFVEIATGVEQPCRHRLYPVIYHPSQEEDWAGLKALVPRTEEHNHVTAYDANAYQIAVANTTSHLAHSMDGLFQNTNPTATAVLADLADDTREAELLSGMPTTDWLWRHRNYGQPQNHNA